MLLIRKPQTTFGLPHPSEGCVEFPLQLLDEHFVELEQKARAAQRGIGQMLRRALGLYFAGVLDRDLADGMCGDSQPDLPPDGSGVLAVTLLLPISRLTELESLAARRDTTASALIRRVICCAPPWVPIRPASAGRIVTEACGCLPR